jgi:hypothetical protein
LASYSHRGRWLPAHGLNKGAHDDHGHECGCRLHELTGSLRLPSIGPPPDIAHDTHRKERRGGLVPISRHHHLIEATSGSADTSFIIELF